MSTGIVPVTFPTVLGSASTTTATTTINNEITIISVLSFERRVSGSLITTDCKQQLHTLSSRLIRATSTRARMSDSDRCRVR